MASAFRSHLRDRRDAGDLAFALLVDTAGTVIDLRMLKSSRYNDLDSSIESVVRAMRYDPLRLEAGCAVPAILYVPVELRMR